MGSAVSYLFGGGGESSPDSSSESSSSSSEASSGGILKFHSSARWQLHFNEIKTTSQLVVIDFAATWCGPCKMMERTLHALAEKYTDVGFVKIDVDEVPDVAREFAVQAMPTFVLVKKGKEVDRVIGAKKDELERKVQKHRT